mgnify:FL=1
MNQLIIETVLVGVCAVILGYIIIYFMKHINMNMSKNHKMIIGLFLLGSIGHLFCEFTGINKWYCKNGHACIAK